MKGQLPLDALPQAGRVLFIAASCFADDMSTPKAGHAY